MHSNKDWTYFMSRLHPGEYAFKKFSHSTMTETVIMDSIMLDDYAIYDICNDGDTLDFAVGLHIPSNEVHVITFVASGAT